MTTQQQAGDPQAADRLTRVEALLGQLVERVVEARQGQQGAQADINFLNKHIDAVNRRIDRLLEALVIITFLACAAFIFGAAITVVFVA